MYISKSQRSSYKDCFNSLKEALEEDNIKVEVDGEVVADTSKEDKLKSSEVPANDISMGASSIINNLIQDEIQAIDSYNSAIQTFRCMINEDDHTTEEDKSKIEKAVKIISDISAEENLHVGQLQEIQKLFNSQAELVADGAEEAKEQITEEPKEKAKEEVMESVESKECVICGKKIEGYGNNASPVREGSCCDECNKSVVIPARLKEYYKNSEIKGMIDSIITILKEHDPEQAEVIEDIIKD